ncbi:hypothetical protein SASPL_150130 [Salvia splendens]|uniref:O-fucosyltransferase family protein n=1 Tax=Salvia splendens TaxID=180675 RepID=A0A8X8W668_SALSN|nr:hypothetical protein SASPL_150130 [Salvia splendens]
MVVRNLLDELMESYNSSISAIPSIKVPAWAPARYYMDEVYPVLQETGYVVSVHLRFEEDMVAFSCCVYDEGETEKSEMEAARKRGRGKKLALKNQISEAGLNRVNGKCPMTPVEVGFAYKFCF